MESYREWWWAAYAPPLGITGASNKMKKNTIFVYYFSLIKHNLTSFVSDIFDCPSFHRSYSSFLLREIAPLFLNPNLSYTSPTP